MAGRLKRMMRPAVALLQAQVPSALTLSWLFAALKLA